MLASAALLLYGAVLLWLTLSPTPFVAVERINLMPLATIRRQLYRGGPAMMINIWGNIAAFVPLGVLVPLVWPLRSWRSIALIGALLSIAIEFTQGLLGVRVVDIDDVLLNMLGAVLGYAVVRLAQP